MAKAAGARSKHLRVLVSGVSWPPETFISRLIDGLLRCGVRITIATKHSPGKEWLERDGFSWLHEPAWEGNYLLRLLRLGLAFGRATLLARQDLILFLRHARQESGWVASLRMLQRLLPYAGRRWDVIYFPWNSGAVERLALFDLGAPVVISCRGTQISIAPHNPERAEYRRGLQMTLARAAATHCVSAAILQEGRPYGLQPETARVIHPGVNTEFFQPAQRQNPQEAVYKLVAVGNLNWIKGHEYALQAVRFLKDSGVPIRFQIIGDGPDQQRILYTIHDLGLEDCVQLLGRQPPAVVRDLLQQADVFLHASLSEGIANVVLEAMACGLPVVVTECGGMREAVCDGEEGFVSAVRDPAALAMALEKLWRDPALRRKIGHQARVRAAAEFTLERQVCQFQKLFSDVQKAEKAVRNG